MKKDANDRPRGLARLLRWYARQWEDEVPRKMHVPGVWVDYGPDAAGGSKLGTPRWCDPFRRYIENRDNETDHDRRVDVWRTGEAYIRPVHAALAAIHADKPMTAQWLYRLSLHQYSLHETPGTPPGDMGRVYARAALELLWLFMESQKPAEYVA